MDILGNLDSIDYQNITKVMFVHSKSGSEPVVQPVIYKLNGSLSDLEPRFNIIKTFNQHLLSDKQREMLTSIKLPSDILSSFEQNVQWGVGIENETLIKLSPKRAET